MASAAYARLDQLADVAPWFTPTDASRLFPSAVQRLNMMPHVFRGWQRRMNDLKVADHLQALHQDGWPANHQRGLV